MKWHDVRKENPTINKVILLYGHWLSDGKKYESFTLSFYKKGRSGNCYFEDLNEGEIIRFNNDENNYWCYVDDIPKPEEK
jgi:hypothetical protein